MFLGRLTQSHPHIFSDPGGGGLSLGLSQPASQPASQPYCPGGGGGPSTHSHIQALD